MLYMFTTNKIKCGKHAIFKVVKNMWRQWRVLWWKGRQQVMYCVESTAPYTEICYLAYYTLVLYRPPFWASLVTINKSNVSTNQNAYCWCHEHSSLLKLTCQVSSVLLLLCHCYNCIPSIFYCIYFVSTKLILFSILLVYS